ncbi:hypothetical protein [Mesorhizobium sp. M7A.F.Ca.CA.004.02.1.1]|uniref:hypothetical protein n=1 Tax=Mesorhizobium sp. M7A.F.Ca.CA.004.02.1.1 TaxID=2496690 RepID=UPI000FCC9176|nr:hypothetical protein [Mesorhizobium sp. M7A.F.Ca.CA.004.02.1.1]RVB02845.1 hypothetical protein EN912_10360 [Mesorhizobium sp. M7A.F.Ca.CA.004.02.1.1]
MNGRTIDQFFTLLVGTVVVVVAIAISFANGSAFGVIAGLVALSVAYVVNMMGAAGIIKNIRTFRVATFFAVISWLASVASIIAAAVSTL